MKYQNKFLTDRFMFKVLNMKDSVKLFGELFIINCFIFVDTVCLSMSASSAILYTSLNLIICSASG